MELELTETTPDADFAVKASVPKEAFPWLANAPSYQLVPQPPPYSGLSADDRPLVLIEGISSAGSKVLTLAKGRDDKGPFSFLIPREGATASVLPDRLYGWRAFAIAQVGSDVWVGGAGGALLKGSLK
jgi:hypothetical protein